MDKIIPLTKKTKLEILRQAEKLAREMVATLSVADLHAPLEQEWALFIVHGDVVPNGLKRVQFLPTKDARAMCESCPSSVCVNYGVSIDSLPVSKRLMATSIVSGRFASFEAMVTNGFGDTEMLRWGREIEQRHGELFHEWVDECADPVAMLQLRDRIISSGNIDEMLSAFKDLWREAA